ncbi:hydrolase [Peribacillus deserti]|uniref:Hydrolase n=1 Tax=Peribacillus deserti TaxID=673318 RepID=A0A2N5M7Q8_9BACI|nr:hydrolase [Peribacillus deserti]PLT30391.1 hydrolase [Peribacillus deserti]
MNQRTFQFDGQWNIVYYPDRPSGFAIMIIGDKNHFVDEKSSFWLQHPGREQILNQLKTAGYTLYSSNLYGANWGSEKSVFLAKRLHHLIMKSEILNERIHIFAEGTGALTALKLMKLLKGNLRSAVFLNPCLSLNELIQKEKDRKFFLNRLKGELSKAYELDTDKKELFLNSTHPEYLDINVPLKIIHVLGTGGEDQSHLYKRLVDNVKDDVSVEIQYLLAEKRYKIAAQARQFFKKYEDIL